MVNEAEKRFIMENRDIVATEKSSWNDFFKRFSFYAIAIQYFCCTIYHYIILNLVTDVFNRSIPR